MRKIVSQLEFQKKSKNLWLEPRTILAYAVSLLALAEMIDISIVAVALPQIMGSIGANIEQIAAINTSYIIVVAIFTPMTGIGIKKYGLKNLVVFATILFGVASMLSGLATTLQQMIFFRIIQGVGGAFFTPITQTYIAENFKKEERSKIMVLYSICVVLGPVLGPTLGGILTANLSWRWCFFANVPLCVISLFLIMLFMKKQKSEKVKVDYISFVFMAFGLGFLEYFIDQGNIQSWFDSSEMVIIFCLALLFIGFFIWRGLLGKSVVNFELFKYKNFMLTTGVTFIVTLLLVSAIAYSPTMLQTVYGYPVETAAYLTAPCGLSSMLVAPLLLKLMKKIDARIIMLFGLLILAAACLMASQFGPTLNVTTLIIVTIMEGVAIMALFIPLMEMVFYDLPRRLEEEGAGFFNLVRCLANSIATSLAASVIARQQQVSFHDLAAHISPYVNSFKVWEQKMGLLPEVMKADLAQSLIIQQSYLISFLDLFYLCGIGLLLFIWIVVCLKAPKATEAVGHLE